MLCPILLVLHLNNVDHIAPLAHTGCPWIAGTGFFKLFTLTGCWTCVGPPGGGGSGSCSFLVPFGPIQIVRTGPAGNITSVVGVPGGGSYILAYELKNDNGGSTNSWQAIISPLNGNGFSPSKFDNISVPGPNPSAGFDYTGRSFQFTLPAGTIGIRLTFQTTGVSSGTPCNIAIMFQSGFYKPWKKWGLTYV